METLSPELLAFLVVFGFGAARNRAGDFLRRARGGEAAERNLLTVLDKARSLVR